MRARIIGITAILFALLGAGTLATRGDGVAPQRQWAVVNFVNPVQIADQFLMGPYLIVHDDLRMARGEPCTTFYRFDPKTGPKEEVLSFHCLPVQRQVCDRTTFNFKNSDVGVKRVTEYQFAGDSEGHGVPGR